MKIKCPKPGCGKVLVVSEEMAGKKGKCNACGTLFQIPAAPKAAKKPDAGKTGASPKKSASPKTPARRPKSSGGTSSPKPAARRKPTPKRPAKVESDYIDDDLIEEDVIDELDDDDLFEEPAPKRRPAQKRRPAPKSQQRRSRPKPPPRDDFFEDDDDFLDDDDFGGGYDEFEDDGFGGGADMRQPRKANWKPVRTGAFILAIAFCVYGASHALTLLGHVLSQGAFTVLFSSLGEAKELAEKAKEIREQQAEAMQGMNFQERQEYMKNNRSKLESMRKEFEEAREDSKDSEETFEGMLDAADIIWRIAHGVAIGAVIAIVVGLCFLLAGPNRGGTLPLAISALSVTAIGMVLVFAFQTIPAISKGVVLSELKDEDDRDGRPSISKHIPALAGNVYRGRHAMILGGTFLPDEDESESSTGTAIVALLIDLCFASGLLLMTIYFVLAATATKDRPQKTDCLVAMGVAIGFMVLLVLIYIFGLNDYTFADHTRSMQDRGDVDDVWAFWIVRIFGWLTELALAGFIVLSIRNLFYAAKHTK